MNSTANGSGSEAPLPAASDETLFRLFIENAVDYSFYVLDVDGLVCTWNQGARRLSGYEAGEAIGKPFGSFFTEEDQKDGKPERLLAVARQTGNSRDEGWRLRKDGTRFWVTTTLTALHQTDSSLSGFAVITHDDTSRYEALKALRRSEERLRLSVEALREHAIYVMSPEGIVESWNVGAERIKGYKANEIIGKHFSLFFTDDDRVSGKPMRELEIATKLGTFEEEGWRVRKDGSRFWASVVVTAIPDPSGKPRGFTKVTRDESAKHQAHIDLQRALERARSAETQLREHANELERRVAERTELLSEQAELLKRTNAELEEFAYIASHDLKEPLRMITSYLDLLRSRYGGSLDARARSYFDIVLSSAERMRHLIEAVLDYTRIEADSAGLEVVQTQQVVAEVQVDLQSAIIESGATLEVCKLPPVRATRLHILRVFQNLIANAIKFRSDRPLRIRISAQPEDHQWIFSIADNGIGIDPKFHDQLFKIFKRLHAADEYAGSGIGLASCKKIIERHGGRIWIDPTVTEGATIRFTLPREA